MSYLIDVLEHDEIVFTLSSDGIRAWQVRRGNIVELDLTSALEAKRENNPNLAKTKRTSVPAKPSLDLPAHHQV